MSIIQGCSPFASGTGSRTAKVGRSVSLYSGSVTSRESGSGPPSSVPTSSSRAPAEDLGTEAGEIADGGDRVVLSRKRDGIDDVQEAGVVGDDVLVRERLGRAEGRRRHDQPHRLEVAEPFLMHANLRVDRHRCYPVTGQR